MDEATEPYIMIVDARSHEDVSDELVKGAIAEIEKIGGKYECVSVPSEFEIAPAINFALRGHEFSSKRQRFDGYVTLGCVIQEEATYAEYVRSIQNLALDHALALGNGVFHCENKDQASEWARIKGRNIGGQAAQTALSMLYLKREYGMGPR